VQSAASVEKESHLEKGKKLLRIKNPRRKQRGIEDFLF